MRGLKRQVVLLLAAMLTGCSSYQPLPLDTDALAPGNPADIRIDVSAMPLPQLRHHKFDPSDGLDMTEVAMLAVANNPGLKLARDERGVAHAQAFAAGLLPDPVLDLAGGFPFNGPDVESAFRLGLAYDLRSLLTHSEATQAAAASARQIDLDLLWKEWQVVSRARTLFIRATYQRQALVLLAQEHELLAQRHAAMVDAHRSGDIALSVLSADLVALQAVERRINDLQRRRAATDQDLDSLLGLSPRAALDLVGSPKIAPVSEAAVDRDLAELPRRRPDLLALAAGYQSEDARYRKAILEQFPAVDVGFVRARDTGGTNTLGFDVSMTLPIFNRNQGNIAIERATRQRLHDEYAIRVLRARADVERILRDQRLLQARRHGIDAGIALATRMRDAARAARTRGDLSGSGYTQVETAWIDDRLSLLAVDRAMLEQQAALQALLGGPVHGSGIAAGTPAASTGNRQGH
ncbi:MAG: TolC family protein [Betaproteobacteria bacterium]